MCRPSYEKSEFFARGAEKGWTAERVERAWEAHTATRDAEAIVAATPSAPKPLPLKVGDRVKSTEQYRSYVYNAEILALDGSEVWVRLTNGDRATFANRCLERV